MIYAGGNFVALHARSAGEKNEFSYRFPYAKCVMPKQGNVCACIGMCTQIFLMREYETRLFMIEP